MGLKHKKQQILLRLELNNQVLYELKSSDLTGEIMIGRNASCNWNIPSTDRSASNYHARLFLKNGRVFIQDAGSRNGIFFKGEKVNHHKLSIGDQIGIGDCKLCVESTEENKSGAVYEYHRLEQLNGTAKGSIYNLNSEHIRIGSSKDCDIVFDDALVSHFHTLLEQKEDGSSWIKDLGSRNGTSVNGTKLSENINDNGRMLRDGDIITVSYIELRFWDRYVAHVRSYLWLKATVVILTVAIILGCFFAWKAITPSAKYHIELARNYARSKQFEQAKSHLEKAADAKDSEVHNFERAELLSQIEQWENTIQKWEETKLLLSKRKWISANNVLSPLLTSGMELWRWNDSDANNEKNHALQVKNLLDVFLEARAVLVNRDSDITQLQRMRDALKREILSLPDNLPDFIVVLKTSSYQLQKEISLTCDELILIRKILSDSAKTFNLNSPIVQLEKLKEESGARIAERKARKKSFSPRVEIVCNDILAPLRKLHASQKVLDENYAYTAMLQFKSINETLPLPSVNECNVSPLLADQRAMLELLNMQLLDNAKQLAAITETMRSMHLTQGTKPDCLERVFSEKILKKVLSCDSFNFAIPKWNRTAPSGDYDKILGIEIFYDFLKSLPDEFDSGVLGDTMFIPDIFSAKQVFATLDVYLEFIEKDTMLMVRDNKVADNAVVRLALYAFDLQEEREAFLKKMVRTFNASDDRKAVIAGGMALLLNNDSKVVPAEFALSVSEKMKKIRKSIADITKKEVTPEQAIRNRLLFLKTGIPGDPLIKQAWAEAGKLR